MKASREDVECGFVQVGELVREELVRLSGEPEMQARCRASVDRAVDHYRSIQAAEAIGHFLRGGKPCTVPRFESPASVRDREAA